MSRPAQHDAHVRAAIMSPDVFLPSASLARIGLADSSEHELDMVSWRDIAAEWDLDRGTAEALLAEARASLPPLEPPPPPRFATRDRVAEARVFDLGRSIVTRAREIGAEREVHAAAAARNGHSAAEILADLSATVDRVEAIR